MTKRHPNTHLNMLKAMFCLARDKAVRYYGVLSLAFQKSL